MTTSVEPGPERPSPAGPGARIDDVPNFEAVFGVPAAHRLVALRSRSRGGPAAAISWEHEEYDASGARIARYESFEETTAAGRRSGWRKYDPAGRLLASGQGLS